MTTGVKDLKLWQEAVALGGDVIRTVRQHNRREVKSLGERVIASATDVAVHIAEGHTRYAPEEQRPLFLAARYDLVALETHLAIARQADLIPATTLAQLSTKAANVSRLLTGYLGYLERQLEPQRPDG